MEVLTTFLSQQPFLALFLVIALGYGLGSINIRGFSLGVGAVIFSGLLIGAIAPKCQPPAMVGTLGLVMFLYGLGVQFGKQFFQGLTGAAGRRYNLLAILALAAAAIVCVVELLLTKISHPLWRVSSPEPVRTPQQCRRPWKQRRTVIPLWVIASPSLLGW